MRRSAARARVAEPIPWRLYLLTFVSWVLLSLLGGPDTVPGSGSGPLPEQPVVAVQEAVARTMRSTFRVTVADDDQTQPELAVALDARADVLILWNGDQLYAFRHRHDAYAINESPGKPWYHFEWPPRTPPQELGVLYYAAFDLEAWQPTLWLDGVTQAQRTGRRTYAGTIDKRRAGPRHPGLVRDVWGDGTSSVDDDATVPFEAEVDSRGRLVRLTLTTGDKGETQTFRLSGFGEPVRPPSPPPSDIEEITP
ncbi:hypothetical protein AB0J74_02915 [Asanoa sp. NPDC049573]|uniref:hypothetical protein n=1 Tax=Asanoa sp. NPDC049573 TaxID=3155396 RepID=UPI00342A0150